MLYFLFKESFRLQKKGLLTGMIALFLFNILFISPFRSGYLALLISVLFLIINLYGHKKLPPILGVIGVIFLLSILTSSTLQQRIKVGLEESKNSQASKILTSIGARNIFRQNTLELIQQKLLLGYGTSSFKNVYSSHVAIKYQDWRGEPTPDPHNQYLFVWLENGLIGLLIFLMYIHTAVRQGVSQQSYGVIAASVLVATASTSLFNSHFKTFPEGHLLAFFTGYLLAQLPIKKSDRERQCSV
jgi:O-antigen ligase